MASMPEAATVRVKVEPDLSDFEAKLGGIAMIVLTHPEGDGPAEGRKYSGRVFVDAGRIQSIEEVLVDGETPVSFLTLRDGIAIRVSETPEQITALMSQALRGIVVASGL
ncbi:hypothetical protein [Mycobacterium sp. NPDC004974]